MTDLTFGRYEVLDEIGDGAMGRVYRAWDPAVSRVVALKTIKPEYLSRDTRDEYLKRFRREAQAAGALSHPCIVRVFDVGEDFLVMELIEGRSLQRVIREDGRLAPEAALRLLGPVAMAVDHAHRAGIVHRDIKPANIMVQPDGMPKLMDFGVAHLEASVMTTAGQILGSPSYMPPEQVAGLEITGRSDVYSLAVVAYEMLTGQTPFQGTITQVIYRVMNEPAPPPRAFNASLPERYNEVFARALAKDPAQRFATASEFVSALDLKDLELALTPLAPLPKERTAARADESHDTALLSPRASSSLRRPSSIAAGIGIVCLLAAGSLYLIRRGTPDPRVPANPPSPSLPVVATPSPALPSPSPAAPAAGLGAPSPVAGTPTPAPARANRRKATPAPLVEGQLVELGPGVTPPRKVVDRTAPYPELARRQRLNGTVVVGLVVDEHGEPTDVSVLESAGSVLDAAALESVRGWRYEPAVKDGVKVKVRWLEKLTYRLR
jgi:serine/threonine-protein kinase